MRPPPPPVNFEDVSTAMFRIRNGIVRTSCNRSHFLSELCRTNIYCKNEYQQFTGSFKVRAGV
jgi:threonine dehydratase